MAKKEPTNRDILESMNKRFNMVFAEFSKDNDRFDMALRQLGAVREDIKEIRNQQKVDGEVLDEINETVEALSKAVDKDAITIVAHETRITRLEKVLKK